MRLLVLGGTHFLGRHVATAALDRGHDVATFTRGVSGEPPAGARALHGDRDDPDALPKALEGWTPDLVVDTSCQTRAAARNAAAVLGGVRGYAFVSSLNAYSTWPPGPVGPEDDDPTHRLGWWLDRISRGGRIVVPDALEQPIAMVDARDLAGWLVEMAERGRGGAVNATGPTGMTTLGGLLEICRDVTGSDAEWVPVPEAELLEAG